MVILSSLLVADFGPRSWYTTRMKRFGLPIILVATVGLLVAIFALGNRSAPPAVLLGEKHADQGQKHIATGAAHETYNSNLPSSGSHYTEPTLWGIKDAALPDETLIHNLEHGGVEIAYKPGLPQAQIDQLKAIFAKLPASPQFHEVKAVLIPRAANDHSIQLAAWTYTYNLDQIDEAKILQFYNDHLDKGPELVP